jgi:prepilin-type N-terminal cleavage/methylation domain-containing protein
MKDRRGFTILELVIALVIVAILVTIGGSNLQGWLSHSSALGLQREILSACNEARTRSVASSLQHRLLFDLGAERATLQRGNAVTGSTAWVNAQNTVTASRGAAIESILYPLGNPSDTAVTSGSFALIFNPNGQVLTQTNPADPTTISPLTQANIRLSAVNDADRATIRLFGWTSKARLLNGWL